jgi:aspartyl-tRNA(Asn)/glutamyl-tRNA(Gln) amidotransferase subunit A
VSLQELVYLSLREAAEQMRQRRLSPVELTSAVVARTVALEPDVHAYITPLFDTAVAAARQAEQEIMDGQYRGPLHGIPIALKDNYWTQGVRTTAGSKILGDFVPTEDGTVVARLRAAGAIFTGKCNMHELALGGTTVNPHYGTTHNPWGLDRIPGGSSGGSAAAVAAGFCLAATGTDTTGSIRAPAAYCGLVGLKPTYGRVSLYGIVPLAWSLDHAGPLTHTVEDAALFLNAIAGYDSQDPASANAPAHDFAAGLGGSIRGVRLGVPRGYFYEPIDPEVGAALETALGVLRDLGAEIQEVSFPSGASALDIYPFIHRPEAASFQEDYIRAQPEDYGADIRPSVELGALVLATDYLRAQRLRRAMRQELEGVLTRVDALVTPTTRAPASPIGRPFTQLGGQPASGTLINTGNTVAFNLTGSPALAVPCGLSADGMPLGLQLVGRAWDETTLLRIGAAYQQATTWHLQQPRLPE